MFCSPRSGLLANLSASPAGRPSRTFPGCMVESAPFGLFSAYQYAFSLRATRGGGACFRDFFVRRLECSGFGGWPRGLRVTYEHIIRRNAASWRPSLALSKRPSALADNGGTVPR